MSQSSSTAAPHKKTGGLGMLIGLAPWVLFTIIAEHGTLKLGAIAALVIAIGVCVYSMRSGSRPKLIELAAVVSFAAFTALAFVADPSLAHWLTRYARAIAAATLALLVFGSLLFVPFTEEYAREQVPQQFWGSAQFKAVNRRLTLTWGAIFSVMTVSHVIAGATDTHRGNLIFNWVVPIGLVLWGMKQSTPPSDTDSAAAGIAA